jgi:hypothetical protein
MMHVVVDANAIIGDYWLRSKRSQLLLSRAHNNLIELHVPEAVLLEVTKHFRADLDTAGRALNSAEREIARLLPAHALHAAIDVDAQAATYETHLRDTLMGAGATFDYPALDPGEVAAMAVARLKPFKLDGSGYVDVVIWLRVRELALTDDVVLISNNFKDFGGTKQGGLDPDLVADLGRVQAIGSVTRYPSASDFHAAALDHMDLYDAQIRDQLAIPAVAGEVESEIFALLEDTDARAAGAWGSIAGAEAVFFDSGDVASVELLEVTDAEPDYGYATFEAHAEATYQFPVLYSEAWEAHEDGIIDDLDIEDIERDIATATRTVRLMMMVDAHYEPGAQRLSQFELTSADVE